MGKGRKYELEIKNSINEAIDQRFVWATNPDYSGVSKGTTCDLAVIHGTNYHNHTHGNFIELKKRRAKEGYRCTVMEGSSDDETGLEELERLIDGCPNWGEPYVVIKFNNREIIVIHAKDLHHYLLNDEVAEKWTGDAPSTTWRAETKMHDARLTDEDSISMRKPALSYWESTTSGQQDHLKLLDQIGGDEISYDDENITVEDGTPIEVTA